MRFSGYGFGCLYDYSQYTTKLKFSSFTLCFSWELIAGEFYLMFHFYPLGFPYELTLQKDSLFFLLSCHQWQTVIACFLVLARHFGVRCFLFHSPSNVFTAHVSESWQRGSSLPCTYTMVEYLQLSGPKRVSCPFQAAEVFCFILLSVSQIDLSTLLLG